MFEYELQQLRHADLVRRADHERQVREATRFRRDTARSTEAEDHTRRLRRHRFARTA